jgi:hypothetical protein
MRVISKDYFNKNDFICHDGRYLSYDLHSKIWATSDEAMLAATNKLIDDTHLFMLNAKFLFLTLGSAFVFKNKANDQVVANCHKQASHLFYRELLTIDEINQALQDTLEQIKALNPSLHIILMISPVRHLRDGLVENQRSKARLIEAVHQQVQHSERIHYFPSYEIILDDLRDYRFYAKDLTNPNELAIDYVWGKFSDSFFNEETIKLNKRIKKITQGLNHRPFNPESLTHQSFVQNLKAEIKSLETMYPSIKF